jgi:DNA-directed RNA polymerase specialized sigma subunit
VLTNTKPKPKPKPKPKSDYFIEKEMIELVRLYKVTEDDSVFLKIAPVLDSLINGMINKEFSYNYHIKNNRADVVSECMYEILKSLKRYDPDKGRLFAYINRIVKNTLIKYYTNSRKIKDKELIYTELAKNSNEEVEDDIAVKVGLNNSNRVIEDFTTIEDSLQIKPKMKNVILDINTSVYITYKYIVYLKEAIQFYLENPQILKNIISELKYDPRISFDFVKYYENKTNKISDYIIYKNVIESIFISLNNILCWMLSNYSTIINSEPETFDGEISNRVIGYIRNFVKKKLNKESLVNYFDINDLTELIQYLTYNRYFKYENTR